MKKIPSALQLGIRRGGLEIRQFARQRESVVFTLLFPVILLAIFGSVFQDTIAPVSYTHLTLPTNREV